MTPDAAPPSRAQQARRWFNLRTASGRLIASIAAGALLGVVTSFVAPHWTVATDAVAGWVGAGVSMLSLSWWLIMTADGHETHCRAAIEDPGRNAVWAIVILASLFSLIAAGVVMRTARTVLHTSEGVTLMTLSLTAVLVAWVLNHTAYALRYAHLYYRDDDEGVGGLDFPGGQPPDYLDFAYFAFTLGMAFQVSDVCISSRAIRRTALGHAVLAFLYNTAILALALNLVFGYLT